MNPSKRDPSKPLEASQFFEILDELGGIDAIDSDSPDESVDAELPPTPLAEDVVRRTIEAARSPQRAQRNARWSGWKRVAVFLPIVVLLGAVPYVLVWSGKNSRRELLYEDALPIVFDPNYPIKARKSALGRVGSSIKMGISRLQDRARETPELRGPTVRALERVRSLVNDGSLIDVRSRPSTGRMAEVLEAFSADSNTPTSERLSLLESFVISCSEGLDVIHRATTGNLAERAQLNLRYINRRLDRTK